MLKVGMIIGIGSTRPNRFVVTGRSWPPAAGWA
jgi:hypothetical protein